MAILTFLSDFGEKDHYVAAVKAAILAVNPSQQIIDISHQIRRHDIGHAAYVMKQVYNAFPEGTVHLMAIDPILSGSHWPVALKQTGHYFVGHDSGIQHLISSTPPEEIVEIPSKGGTFPARDTLAPAAARLAQGESLASIGKPIAALQVKMDRQLKATKREMVGQVIHIDHYGNLITNINKQDFDAICALHGGNPEYTLRFARELFTQIHQNYRDVEAGDCFVLFNSYGFLEIGINKGRAAELLGLKLDTPVIIEFKQ